MATLPTPVARPGGRSARVRAAVHAAVAELIAETDRANVTIPAVAARAGVNPTTIYRRWGDAQQLLADVAVAQLLAGGELPDTGTVRGDLTRWAEQLLARISRPEKVEHLRSVVAAAGAREGRGQCVADLNAQAETIIARAEQRGEPAPTVVQILDHIAAPLYFRAMFGVPDGDVAPPSTLVDELLD